MLQEMAYRSLPTAATTRTHKHTHLYVHVAVAFLLWLAIFFKLFSYTRFAFMIAVQKPLSLDRRAIALARRLAQ